MKVSAVSCALTALLIGAVAQSISESGLPSCAQSCVQVPSSCNLIDIKCICSTQSFINNITCCVARSCDQTDQAATVKYAQQLCGSAGVTVPSSVVCSSGSSSISGASKTSSATSTATNSGSGTTTSATAASKSSGTSAAAPIAHSRNGGAFAAVGAAAAFVAMLLM